MEDVTLEQLLEEPVTPVDNQEPEPTKEVDNLGKATPTPSPDAGGKVEKPIVAVVPYTSDELKSIPIERLDPERVPEQAKPYYEAGLREKKGLQEEFTRKSQELANLRGGTQPRTIEEAFDRDPSGVLGRIGDEIDQREIRLANLDPMIDIEESKAIRTEIARLRSLDRNLNQRGVASNRQVEWGNRVIADTMSEVRTIIKDYDSNREAIEKFAIDDLGYTEQEIGVMTDPRIVGKVMAIKNFKAVNRLFEASEAVKSANKKLLKPKPNQLEKDTVPSGKEEDDDEVYESPQKLKKFLGV